MKIARTMESTASETKGDNPDLAAMRNTIDRHWQIEDPTGSRSKRISRSPRTTPGCRCTSAYDDTVPYIANVSLSVHFDKTVKVQ